jgi:hypothetical protein
MFMPYWILVCDTLKIIIPLTASTKNYRIPSDIGKTRVNCSNIDHLNQQHGKVSKASQRHRNAA